MRDEWEVVSYVGRRYNAFAVASLQPSFAPRPISPVHVVQLGKCRVWVRGKGRVMGGRVGGGRGAAGAKEARGGQAVSHRHIRGRSGATTFAYQNHPAGRYPPHQTHSTRRFPPYRPPLTFFMAAFRNCINKASVTLGPVLPTKSSRLTLSLCVKLGIPVRGSIGIRPMPPIPRLRWESSAPPPEPPEGGIGLP